MSQRIWRRKLKTQNWSKTALDREKWKRALLSGSKPTKNCSTKRRRCFTMHRVDTESAEHEEIFAAIFTETVWKAELGTLTLWSRYNSACSETSGSIVKQRLVFTFRGPGYTQNVLCWLRTQGVASTHKHLAF